MDLYTSVAIQAALEAGAFLMAQHGRDQALEYKLKTDFRTPVDVECDRLIRQRIGESFPEHSLISEEADSRTTRSELTWVIDPLDGTFQYTSGISDYFTVNIALVQRTTPILGVTYAPRRNELYLAEAGQGAFCNGRRLQTALSVSDLNKAMFAMDYGSKNRAQICDDQRRLVSPDGVTYLFTLGCSSLALAFVASGKLHGYLGWSLEQWDMAAGVAHVREAGGIVTTREGKEWALGDTSIVAVASPALHDALMAHLWSPEDDVA